MLVSSTYVTATTNANGEVSQSTVTTSASQPVVLVESSAESGLTHGNIVVICVALGIGIPSLLAAILGIFWMTRRRNEPQNDFSDTDTNNFDRSSMSPSYLTAPPKYPKL